MSETTVKNIESLAKSVRINIDIDASLTKIYKSYSVKWRRKQGRSGALRTYLIETATAMLNSMETEFNKAYEKASSPDGIFYGMSAKDIPSELKDDEYEALIDVIKDQEKMRPKLVEFIRKISEMDMTCVRSNKMKMRTERRRAS